MVGTNEIVGPGLYRVQEACKTSKHRDVPQWTIGKDARKGLNNTVWTKNETYHMYRYISGLIIALLGDKSFQENDQNLFYLLVRNIERVGIKLEFSHNICQNSFQR
jgi:hypothetical protein